MTDQLSLAFAALADPTRRAMLARLAEGRVSVSELAEPFLDSMSLPAVTKHVQVLERAGLVTKTREAQRRPCELNTDGLRDIADWVEPYRAMWEETFDRLDDYLRTVTAKQNAASEQERAKDKPTKTTTAKPQAKPKVKAAKPKPKSAKPITKTTTTKAKPPEAARGDKKARGGKHDGRKK